MRGTFWHLSRKSRGRATRTPTGARSRQPNLKRLREARERSMHTTWAHPSYHTDRKPRYNATWSIIMLFISNLVLMFNLFVMVVTRYLRYDIRNSIGQLLREAADEDTTSPLPSSFY
uniref:Uncharacterized protein n=1 Tax=Rhipicephalus microplus TaxID=6941 RepID=A0A6G5A2Q7_RHIMP